MALTAAFFASLVTWHVDDPSFSYAADAPVAQPPRAAGRRLRRSRHAVLRPGRGRARPAPRHLSAGASSACDLPRRPFRQRSPGSAAALLLSAALCLPAGARRLAAPDRPRRRRRRPRPRRARMVRRRRAFGRPLRRALRRPRRPFARPPLGGLPAPAGGRRTAGGNAGAGAARLEEDDEDEDDESISVGRLRLAAGILAHWALTARCHGDAAAGAARAA